MKSGINWVTNDHIRNLAAILVATKPILELRHEFD